VARKTDVCQYYYEDIKGTTLPDSRSALRLRRYWWNLKRNVWYASVLGIPAFLPKAFSATKPGKLASRNKKTTRVADRKQDSTRLKTGDLVEVRSAKEIFSTLNAEGKLNGLRFTPEMEKFCGKRFKVYKTLDKIILETTGEMRKIRTPTVVLEGVLCDGTAHGGCDRSCFCFWRENWLKKLPPTREEQPSNKVQVVPHSKPTITQDDIDAVTQVLASGNIAQGEKVKEFENALAKFIKTKYAAACSSGTAALHLALLSLGVGQSDEVIMPSYVCASPYYATLHLHAVPKIVDIQLTDLNLCTKNVKDKLSDKTKAIIVPHMFGTPAQIDELLELGIPVIEDCAQALGAELKHQKVGSFGELSIFSFYATKMITTGEGGMVLTNNSELHSKITDARDCDKKPLDSNTHALKYNYKMTDFQAALGISQMNKLQSFIERRRKIASNYTERLSQYKASLPREQPDKKLTFYRYVIMVDQLEQVQQSAAKKGIICERPVWEPIHRSRHETDCPNSDYAYDHALSIPIYPSLTEQETEYVIENLGPILKETSEKTLLQTLEKPLDNL
jgi:perosamine synthetase